MNQLPYWIALGALTGFIVAWRSGCDAFPLVARVLWPLDDVRIQRHPLLHRLGLCALGGALGAGAVVFIWVASRAAFGTA